VGLQGTGDGLRNSPFTEQSLRAMLQNLGISTEGGASRANNVAAVIVTANLPPFASSALTSMSRCPRWVTRHRCAAARLVMTSLSGADGQIYAVAQGSVIVSASRRKAMRLPFSRARDCRTTARWRHHRARDPNDIQKRGGLVYQLRNPDFSTAVGMADVINAYAEARYDGPSPKPAIPPPWRCASRPAPILPG
jgi:flagellar P-ring protein precursor FlgI